MFDCTYPWYIPWWGQGTHNMPYVAFHPLSVALCCYSYLVSLELFVASVIPAPGLCLNIIKKHNDLLTLQTHCPNNWYEYDHSKQPDYLKLIRKFPWLNNNHPVPATLCLCFELEKELNKFILGASHLHTNMTMDKLESSLHLKSVHSYGSQFRFMLQMMRTLYIK